MDSDWRRSGRELRLTPNRQPDGLESWTSSRWGLPALAWDCLWRSGFQRTLHVSTARPWRGIGWAAQRSWHVHETLRAVLRRRHTHEAATGFPLRFCPKALGRTRVAGFVELCRRSSDPCPRFLEFRLWVVAFPTARFAKTFACQCRPSPGHGYGGMGSWLPLPDAR